MYDLTIRLENQPGALAAMSEALGAAGISIEGGGAFVIGKQAVAHFLFDDGPRAQRVLEAAGIEVDACRVPLLQRLDQDTPGQLGKITRLMADAGVNIEVLYSDHDGQLVLVVNDDESGADVSRQWSASRAAGQNATSPLNVEV
jgi:hypothetical protein